MNEIMISVIIPIYNTEKYLCQCIESVLNQSYPKFELLLINDGSKDRSGEICDEYAKKDNRIKVFHKENGGVSSARNLGLDNANGDYICFIDADDYVGKRYLEIHLPDNDEDFIQSSVKILENDYLKPIMTHDEIFIDYNQFWRQSRQVWPTNCLLSKKIIDEYNIRYNENIKMGEDGLFNHMFISKCKTIKRVPDSEYFYNFDNNQSASHKYYENRLEQQKYLLNELVKIFEYRQIYMVCWDYWHEVLNHYRVKGLKKKNKLERLNARKKIKETYLDSEFRKCLPYVRKYGSLDEKIESYCMNIYMRWIYVLILKLLTKL